MSDVSSQEEEKNPPPGFTSFSDIHAVILFESHYEPYNTTKPLQK